MYTVLQANERLIGMGGEGLNPLYVQSLLNVGGEGQRIIYGEEQGCSMVRTCVFWGLLILHCRQ